MKGGLTYQEMEQRKAALEDAARYHKALEQIAECYGCEKCRQIAKEALGE